VPALEHYRVVHVSEEASETPASRAFRFALSRQGQQAQPIEVQPWVKTFERVPGATVEGSGAPPNTTVTAQVRIASGQSGFVYEQTARTDEQGRFSMTLPYSTTGHDAYGPENGYTNVSAQAVGPYQFSTPVTVNRTELVVSRYNATVDVPEGLVNGAEDGTVGVQMTETVLTEPEERDATNGTEASLSGPTGLSAPAVPARG
jgi:dolichyl-diphosphooligosaccharide--protein glycosyltransferase